jgi:hypothetical protein
MVVQGIVFWLPTGNDRCTNKISQNFVLCFMVSFDRYDVPTHTERCYLLLKLLFRVEFSILASSFSSNKARKNCTKINLVT